MEGQDENNNQMAAKAKPNKFIYSYAFHFINAISTAEVCTTLNRQKAIPLLFHDIFVRVSQKYEIYLLRS